MYCDLWPYVLWPLDLQIQIRIVSSPFEFSIHKRKLHEETVWNVQAFMNSKNNSCRGNYMRKYGNWFPSPKQIHEPKHISDKTQSYLNYYQTLSCGVLVRIIALPHEPFACGSVCGMGFELCAGKCSSTGWFFDHTYQALFTLDDMVADHFRNSPWEIVLSEWRVQLSGDNFLMQILLKINQKFCLDDWHLS